MDKDKLINALVAAKSTSETRRLVATAIERYVQQRVNEAVRDVRDRFDDLDYFAGCAVGLDKLEAIIEEHYPNALPTDKPEGGE